MRGAFGHNPWFPDSEDRRRVEPHHTGILCPFCREGQLYVGHDPAQTRWGVDPYYVGCTNNSRQGAICPWMEQTRQDGQAISTRVAEYLKGMKDNLQAQVAVLQQCVPALRRFRLQEYKGEGLYMMYGPPSV